jgi:hypothetical protein
METITGTPNELQRTPEWMAQRLGRFSCSQFSRLMTEPRKKEDKEKGNLSDGAITYVYECVAERLTGTKAKEDFTSKFTDWGIQNEPIAVAIYDEVKGCKSTDSDYIEYGENSGGSPDRLVGDEGILEIKCPFTITSHLEHKLEDLRDKPEYFWQCMGYLLITGRRWIDFVSYHPLYPGKLQFILKRLNASDYEPELKLLKSKLDKSTEIFNLITNSLI